jgi:hypothetical protein
VYTHHAPLRVHSFDEAPALAPLLLHHDTVYSTTFPQPGRHCHSIVTWVDGTGSDGSDLDSAPVSLD